MSSTKQQGSALILALMLVLLVATLSYALFEQRQSDIRRTQWFFADDNAYLIAQKSVTAATVYLAQSLRKDQHTHTMEPQVYNLQVVTDYADWRISATLTDMQSRLNLNNCVNPLNKIQCNKFLSLLFPQWDQDKINGMLQTITASARGVHDNSESSNNRQTTSGLVTMSAIAALPGITPEVLNQLLTNATVLPEQTSLNINTANALVLATLTPLMKIEDGQQLIDYRRQQQGFKDTTEFVSNPIFKSQILDFNNFTLLSNYFLLTSDVSKGKQHWLFYNLLKREIKNNQVVVSVLWQLQGSY